jgi:hypothetical protein
MMKLFIGFALGVLFMVFVRFALLWRKDKKGRDHMKYNALPLSGKMKVIVRKIIVCYSILEFNRDFLLNIRLKDETIIQLLHRSHYPQIIADVSDVKFGIAIYIPCGPLTERQRECLVSTLNGEEIYFIGEGNQLDYFLIDGGTRVKHIGYLLTKILTEVYNAEDVEVDLYDEGFLPYHYKFDLLAKRNLN